MHRYRRNRIAALAGTAVLSAAVVAPATAARAAAAHPVAMPRFVLTQDDEIVVVDATGRTTVYTPGGERVSQEEPADHMTWPAKGEVTSEFGQRWGRMHNGIDIGTPTGTKITAAASGRVTFAGWKGGYGKTVEIDHGNGTVTRYAHQATMKVAEDDWVTRGQKIGEVGMTGSSTGPHLHFEVHTDGDEDDPREYLA